MHHTTFKHKIRSKGIGSIILYVLMGLSIAVLFAFLFGYFIMLLWNWLIPDLLGVGTINYFQAVGLAVLTRLLFGTFGHKHDKEHKSGQPFMHKKPFFSKKKDFSKWKHYDKFWNEEGLIAYNKFADKQENEHSVNDNDTAV